MLIGSIPTHWTQKELSKTLAKIGPGVKSIELLKVFDTIFLCILNN